LGNNARAGNSAGGVGTVSRRPLMYAVVVLLGLILLLTITGAWLGIRPVVLIGFPVAIISATALILALLVLAAPNEEAPQAGELADRLALSFCPTLAIDANTGRVVMANAAARELFGPARVAVGAGFSELLTSGAPPRCRELITDALRDGHADASACAVHTRGGGVRVVHIRARPVRDPERQIVAVGFVANDAGQAVADFAGVQERLMSNISHELRTPLNVIMGFSELLTSGTLGELADNQLDAAQEIHIGGERILRLVTDILDIGRPQSYHLPSEERVLDPAEMIRRIERLLVGQARREDVDIVVDVPEPLPPIQVRERPFKQVLYHLMLHGLDRSGPGDTVMVSAWADGVLTITVTDSGPAPPEGEIAGEGLPELTAEQAREQLAPPMLGLPLCAALAASFGGRIVARSDAEGSHFALEMPIGHASPG